jgi:3' terminal RNA ribose 2'-O-methyltransferase Hen1
MLLSITTTHQPATDLGYLLAKHPDKCQTFSLSYGAAHVFYPQADDAQCTACLLLDIDPIGLVRGRDRNKAKAEGTLAQYVNDRPYVTSSFMSVAIAQVLGSALRGSCKERPELAAAPIPLEASLSVVPCRGGEPFLRRLFEPLGYTIEATRPPLDEKFPEWGDAPYYRVRLAHTITLSDLLTHLYVLLPVLDNSKHYWVGRDELEKLLDRGEGWLSDHPERDEIARRYLKDQRSLAREAIERLMASTTTCSTSATSRASASSPRASTAPSRSARRTPLRRYFEVDVPLFAIESIYSHLPLTQELVQRVNSKTELASLLDDFAEIGYPVAI